MTPQEEKLVLELHAKWGNRWSRIARKLPGRTDNEIKNYWRTHTRKKAQERKMAMSPSSSSSAQKRERAMSPSSSSSNSSPSPIITTANPSAPFPEAGEAGFYDTGGDVPMATAEKISESTQVGEKSHSKDDIWKDIVSTIEPVCDGFSEEGCNFACLPMASPPWQYFPDTLWSMEEEESKMFFPSEIGTAFLTG